MTKQEMAEQTNEEFIMALDAGGTMTDTILVRGNGSFVVGKSLTNREEEYKSYMESVSDAAGLIGTTSDHVHGNCASTIYAGTGMLNTILTGTGRKVGLLVTRGFEQIALLEGGLTYLGQTQNEILHQQLHEHTRPMVDPKNVLGISERICGGSYFLDSHLPAGDILIPLNREHVRQATEQLIEAGVEVIGILFLNSFVRPDHELEAAEIARSVIEQKGADIPVVCSVEIAPVTKENNRVKSLLFQCFAAEMARSNMKQVENAAREDGYKRRLLTLLSYGGAVNIEYPRLYETVISGPIGGLLGAQVVADKLGIKNVITADMGGTSFDVGLLVDRRLGISKSADFAGHRLALPMVDLDSIGSGAGSAVWVDEYKRLHVGPESAGSEVGICYKYDKLTVTDVNVVLGYIDPDYFLGGKAKLDRDRAYKALEEVVAKPLGLDVYEAGRGILKVVNTQMRDLAVAMLASKGYDSREFTMMCYGGAGPVHMWGYSEGIELEDVVTMPWAAGFSAFGGACAEYMHRYDRGCVELIRNNLSDEGKLDVAKKLDHMWRTLEEEAREELRQEGMDVEDLTFRYGVYARYIGQLESFDTPLDSGEVSSASDIDKIIAEFEKSYTKIYPEGARFPDNGYSITEVYLQAIAPKPKPALRKHELAGEKPSDAAYVETRKAYHEGQWVDFTVWQMEELKAGNVVAGPAIIRDPMTTVVIPPEKRVELDEYLILHYR
jgi:N-methylhydantoinase A